MTASYATFEGVEQADVHVRPTVTEDVGPVARLVERNFGSTAANEATIRRVLAFNSEAIFTVLIARPAPVPLEVAGCYATLLLNSLGRDALLANSFNGRDPDLKMLCAPTEQPVALYGWMAIAPGLNRWARPMVDELMAGPRYEPLDFYSRGVTEAGIRALTKLGCSFVDDGRASDSGRLMVKRAILHGRAA